MTVLAVAHRVGDRLLAMNVHGVPKAYGAASSTSLKSINYAVLQQRRQTERLRFADMMHWHTHLAMRT